MALFTYHNHTHLSCWVNNGNTQNTQDKVTSCAEETEDRSCCCNLNHAEKQVEIISAFFYYENDRSLGQPTNCRDITATPIELNMVYNGNNKEEGECAWKALCSRFILHSV